MEENNFVYTDNSELIEEKKEFFKIPSVWQVGLLFSFVVIIFLYLGTRLQNWNLNYGLILTEVGLIFLPSVLFLLVFKFNPQKVLRLNNPGIKNILLIFGIVIFSIPVIGVLNILNYWVIKQIFGNYEIFQAPISTESWGLPVGILIIGVLAGICEEVLFRGVIQRGFENLGPVKSILFTSVLFGFMHVDFQRFLGTFILGALLGYLAYKSNSLFCSIFAHFANNSIAVCMTYVSLKASEILKKSNVNAVENIDSGDIFKTFATLSPMEITVAVVLYAMIFCFSAIWLYFLLRFFAKNNSKRGADSVDEVKAEGKVSLRQFSPFLPGLSLILFIYVLKMLSLGSVVDSETIIQIYRAIGL